jgi:hypothetical protein
MLRQLKILLALLTMTFISASCGHDESHANLARMRTKSKIMLICDFLARDVKEKKNLPSNQVEFQYLIGDRNTGQFRRDILVDEWGHELSYWNFELTGIVSSKAGDLMSSDDDLSCFLQLKKNTGEVVARFEG